MEFLTMKKLKIPATSTKPNIDNTTKQQGTKNSRYIFEGLNYLEQAQKLVLADALDLSLSL